jgi:hypothetical protein
MWTSPVVGAWIPARSSRSDVLPTPLGPISPILPSGEMATLIPRNRSKAPKEMPRLDAVRMDIANSVEKSKKQKT